MTTKTPPKKKTTPKKETPKYVGVNDNSVVYISAGPIQLDDDWNCIFPDKYCSNRWTTEFTDAKFRTRQFSDMLTSCEENSYCTTYQEFIKAYPEFTLNSDWELAGKPSKHAINAFEKQVVFTLGDNE